MSTTSHKDTLMFFQNSKLQALREQNRFSGDLKAVQRELRSRRKIFLGSNLSLCSLVYTNGRFDEEAVEELSRYLSARTIRFGKFDYHEAETFFFRFYVLAITAITHERVRAECVDDILQFAKCLGESKQTFLFAMEGMLPDYMIGELHEFIDTCADEFYRPYLEDGVLGAICVLLGVIPDPLSPERSGDIEEN